MSAQAVEAFDSVEQALAAVEEHLVVLNQTSLEGFVAFLSPLECAKLQVSLAYSINALLFVFMKTQGISSKDIRQTHVKQELERVKAFIKKIKGAEELSKGPKLVLDKDASKRFIQSALSTDQVYIDAVKTRKGDQDSTEAQSPMGDQLKKRATAKPCSKKSKRQRKR
ncbi:unnamed protein product [Peronospora belbahrii]|uniref:Nuclear nucleic acid-binding protein C1D n=1 Tax=Peronospora belbahrii TaxID=622444 RepID=A0AAU9L5B9_9STRA|nr:unnamed protein product [Peronospora belbahrii]CAH0514907.1 unnamed protein product [Peronospora belbahrii]